MNNKYILIVITIVFSFIMLFSAIGLYKKRMKNVCIESLGIYAAYLIFLYFEFNSKIKVNYIIIILTLTATTGHILIGKYYNMYYKSTTFDRYLHAFGTMSFSLFTYSIINSFTSYLQLPKLYTVVFVICLGTSIGTIFELLEFANDCFSKIKCQHGLKDTNVDLLSNLIGSIIGGLFSIYFFYK